MFDDFIHVKQLEGELKLSQKRKGFGCSITTKEIIFQKPHVSYHVLLEDIVGLIPASAPSRNITFEVDPYTIVSTRFSSHFYKMIANKARVITRSGASDRGETVFYISLSDSFMKYFAKLSQLVAVPVE